MTDCQHVSRHSASTDAGSPDVWGVNEADTGLIQYVGVCPRTGKAAVTDAVLNTDPACASTSTASAERVLASIEKHDLAPGRVLDTHPHADHLMASHWLRKRTGALSAIGEKVGDIAELWRSFLPQAGRLSLGAPTRRAAHGRRHVRGGRPRVPRHVLSRADAGLDHLCRRRRGDRARYADVSRCGVEPGQLPGGSAAARWHSIQAILAPPEETRLFAGHDYGTEDRSEPMWEASVAEHLASNKHMSRGASERTMT